MEYKYQFFTVHDNMTPEDIKKQYRRLSFKYHPDQGGDHETMTKVNMEYTMLLGALKDKAQANNDRSTIQIVDDLLEGLLDKLNIPDQYRAELKNKAVQFGSTLLTNFLSNVITHRRK